jgi:hypothetical protein
VGIDKAAFDKLSSKVGKVDTSSISDSTLLDVENQMTEKDEHAIANERMMKWFAFDHLKGELKVTSRRFYELASAIVCSIEPGPERTVALRKLLEAKDAAVRATLNPCG